jgi:parvulin-like peptidyl-prolyl isomerase
MQDRGVSTDAFNEALRQDAFAEKLREKIQASALAKGPQRRVAEIFLENQSLPQDLPEGAVKARHILYSPKDDPSGASKVPANDPSWKEAETAAKKAYETLKKNPERFDELARAESDEGSADVSGGKLPWFDPSQVTAGQLDPVFGGAIFKEGLKPLQILEPVKSAFGWHVIQMLYNVPDQEQAAALKSQIESGSLKFADAARDYSAGPEAAKAGELGWVAHYQLDSKSEQAIFGTPVGKITSPVAVDGDGVHLYEVEEEQTREPDADQKAKLESSAFTNWYSAKKADYQITRDPSLSGTDSGTGAG